MRILSLNIGIKQHNTQQVIDFLLAQNADVICLQEVSYNSNQQAEDWLHKKYYIDQSLHKLYPYTFFGPLFCTQKLWTTGIDMTWTMQQWNYIISKFPIQQAKQIFYHKEYQYITDWSTRRQEDHWRALTIANIITPTSLLQCVTIHGVRTSDKLGDERTKHQTEVLFQETTSAVPTVIIWDFNLLPETQEIQSLWNKFLDCNKYYNIVSTRPHFDDWLDKWNQQVDYCFLSNTIKCTTYEVPQTTISDHLPLIVDIEI